MSLKQSTLEEEFAWQILVCGLAEPKREYRFCERLWRLDFAWPERKLAVELEGGVFKRGWHQSIQRYLADMEKYNALALAGWTLLRYGADRVNNGEAVAELERFLK